MKFDTYEIHVHHTSSNFELFAKTLENETIERVRTQVVTMLLEGYRYMNEGYEIFVSPHSIARITVKKLESETPKVEAKKNDETPTAKKPANASRGSKVSKANRRTAK